MSAYFAIQFKLTHYRKIYRAGSAAATEESGFPDGNGTSSVRVATAGINFMM
jgi:hypothetical protein